MQDPKDCLEAGCQYRTIVKRARALHLLHTHHMLFKGQGSYRSSSAEWSLQPK